jgi:hypothetical protein
MVTIRLFVVLSLTFFSTLFAIQEASALSRFAKVTVIVTDEAGRPVEGAKAGVTFEVGNDVVPVSGKTDSEGRFTATHINDTNHISFGGDKNGYYSSWGAYNFTEVGIGRWKPWDPEIKIILRKIGNKVPMYVRYSKMSKQKVEIPEIGKQIGFDLIKYDWVIPYGIGQNADLIFKLEKKYIDKNNFDAKLTITFSNKLDGIKLIKENRNYGSEYKLPRYATETGYMKELIISKSSSPDVWINKNYYDDDNYIFRIRSEEKDGELVKGMYGKIVGPIEIDPIFSDTAKITIKYYVNPDYTRNLEFDPKHNLFGNLQDLEQVTEP